MIIKDFGQIKEYVAIFSTSWWLMIKKE